MKAKKGTKAQGMKAQGMKAQGTKQVSSGVLTGITGGLDRWIGEG